MRTCWRYWITSSTSWISPKNAIIMVLSFIVIVPVSAVVIGVLSESNRDLGVAIPIIWAAIFLVWLGVGIRQWIVFSKWMQKQYRLYKELQKKSWTSGWILRMKIKRRSDSNPVG